VFQTQKKYCAKCGKIKPPEAKYCVHCGEKVFSSVEPYTSKRRSIALTTGGSLIITGSVIGLIVTLLSIGVSIYCATNYVYSPGACAMLVVISVSELFAFGFSILGIIFMAKQKTNFFKTPPPNLADKDKSE
jgi:hypothetical protein